METYLTVVFWMMLVRLILLGFTMAFSTYPRVDKRSLGFDVAKVLFAVPFFIWVIYLKWWVVS